MATAKKTSKAVPAKKPSKASASPKAPATKTVTALKPIKTAFNKSSLAVHVAEQAGVEPKAVKAVLVFQGIDFPRTHDIRRLLALLDPTSGKVPEEIWEAVDLTDYAVETRYPGTTEPVTEDEYRQAVAMAEKVVQWVEEILSTSRE